jgi:hypothetical protein
MLVPTDPRDELWRASFESFYDSTYGEAMAKNLIDRWQKVDEITRALVAITASTSAVSGWALWSKPEFHGGRLVISGIAALLAILHASLGVPGRIKDHAEDKRRFLSLRSDLETFRYEMRINPNFDVNEFSKRFLEFRKRYSDAAQAVKNDIAATRPLAKATQGEVNQRLASEINEIK